MYGTSIERLRPRFRRRPGQEISDGEIEFLQPFQRERLIAALGSLLLLFRQPCRGLLLLLAGELPEPGIPVLVAHRHCPFARRLARVMRDGVCRIVRE